MPDIINLTSTKDEVKGFFLALLLISAFALSLITATSSAGPVILGTEMNTNGQVEYMCLGQGCENFTNFQFSDK